MIDRRIARITVPKRKRRTRGLIGAVQRADDGSDKSRLARSERSGKCDDVAGKQPARERGREIGQCGLVGKSAP